jgi:hypothetical protein
VLLIDQLKEIYIDGVLDAVDTTQWYPKIMRKDYTVGVTVGENGLDDPDQQFYEKSASLRRPLVQRAESEHCCSCRPPDRKVRAATACVGMEMANSMVLSSRVARIWPAQRKRISLMMASDDRLA